MKVGCRARRAAIFDVLCFGVEFKGERGEPFEKRQKVVFLDFPKEGVVGFEKTICRSETTREDASNGTKHVTF